MQLINQNNSFLNDRGFKSLHCQRWSDSKLRWKRDKGVTKQYHDAGIRRLVIALGARAFIDRRLFGLRKLIRAVRSQAETLQDLEFFISRVVPSMWHAAGLSRLHGDFVLRRCRQPAKGLPETIGLNTGGQT